MARQRKPYNPNTAYGRRKMREESVRWRESLPPEEREKLNRETNSMGCLIVLVLIVVVFLICLATGNMAAFFKVA
jgi:hypothetical protein